MVSVMRLMVRSITTFAIPPFWIRASMYFLIFWSSTSLSENVLPPNQLESQPRTMPSRKPTGLIFCPIIPWFLFQPFLFPSSVPSSPSGPACDLPPVLHGSSACVRDEPGPGVQDAVSSVVYRRQHILPLQRGLPLPTSHPCSLLPSSK